MAALDLDDSDYQVLGEFRRRLRRFLHFSERAALAEGLEPRQHQLMLEVRSAGEPEGITVGRLAERLLVRPHSAAELIDRLAEKGLAVRVRGGGDRRQVRIRLTREGEAKLRRLSIAHRAELREAAPELVAALQELMAAAPTVGQTIVSRRLPLSAPLADHKKRWSAPPNRKSRGGRAG